jgi:tRNA pseudouridine13 synthase
LLVPRLERNLGIEVYATRSPGVGGVIRRNVEDFMVEEMLVDGSEAHVSKLGSDVGRSVLGSSSSEKSHLLCVLVKRNWDTFIALMNVARRLGISSSRVQIAGIKDAKAVTAQFISIENVSAEEVQKLDLRDIEVRPVGYLRSALSAFYLLGNDFHVAVRGVRFSEMTVRRRFKKIVEEMGVFSGVPNFFGHQRFGTSRPITHLVGRAIVKGCFEEAVMLFLAKASVYEHPASRRARLELGETRDFRKALRDFPRQLRYERLMLEGLVEKPGDFVGAFKRLPVRLRGLFVQAYASYLFNRFLSGRVKGGVSLSVAEVGDFVVGVERCGVSVPAVWKVVSVENRGDINRALGNGRMRLAVPLIGYRQRMSDGVQGDVERGVLEEEDVCSGDFRVGVLPEMSSKGELRSVVAPVRGLSYDYVSGGEVNLEFMLYRGSYATVVLREFMKVRELVEAGF